MQLLHTAHVPVGDGPFATVFALHGWGAGAHDLLGLAQILPERVMMLCPQGEVQVPIGPGMVGYGWFPLVPGEPPDPEAFRSASAALRRFVEEARRAYPVEARRSFVLGFSQGGLMAYDHTLRDPEPWAGLMALSTWLPEVLLDDLPRLDAQRHLQALVIHGTEDPLVEVDKGRQSKVALEQLGVEPSYHEFPMAHEIRPEALHTLRRWLDERL